MADSAMTDMVAELIGPSVKLHHTKINAKQPGSATEVKWHQDFPFTPHSNSDLITALLMVDEVTPENGPLEVQPGSLLLEQGARAGGFYIVLAGELAAQRSEPSASRSVGHLRPGDIFGEMSLLDHAPAEITVQATVKSFLLELPASVFREVIMTHPQVLMMVSDLADSRRKALERVLAGEGAYPTGGMRLI